MSAQENTDSPISRSASDAKHPGVSGPEALIEIKGARVHNLKNIDVKIPRGKLVVVTGLSGSGKSSLAFDTLYAEGYRKYMDSLSVGARSLLEQMEKPDVDYIHGLTPVIAIEQRADALTNPRTTVASTTEILDYARLLWPIAGEPRCPLDGGKIEKHALDDEVDSLMKLPAGTKIILTAPVISAKPSIVREEVARLEQKGFSRVRVDGKIREISEPDLWSPKAKQVALEVVVDRLVMAPEIRSRLADSLEIAFKEGQDKAVALIEKTPREDNVKSNILSIAALRELRQSLERAWSGQTRYPKSITSDKDPISKGQCGVTSMYLAQILKQQGTVVYFCEGTVSFPGPKPPVTNHCWLRILKANFNGDQVENLIIDLTADQTGFGEGVITEAAKSLQDRGIVYEEKTAMLPEEVKADHLLKRLDLLQARMKAIGQEAANVYGNTGIKFEERQLRQSFSCAVCGTVYPPLTPRHFSYNHPEGACPACAGLGKALVFAPELVVPDPTKSVRGGAIKAWRVGPKRIIIRQNSILKQLAEQVPFDPETPWQDLPQEVRDFILYGDKSRKFSLRTWSKKHPIEERPFEGVLAALDYSFAHTSSEWLKARLMSFQIATTCKVCGGRRLNPYSLAVRLNGIDFAGFVHMSVEEAHAFAAGLLNDPRLEKLRDAVTGLERRLHFLNETGLGYLTLEREYVTLSGGEAQRVRLASQLGMGLVGVTYVLDEPSIGLHPHDNGKLLGVLKTLRDIGNTVVVVEHDESTLCAADCLIELGPGAGHQGGHLVFSGTPQEAMKSKDSISGPFLAGEQQVVKNAQTIPPTRGYLTVKGAAHNNLKNIDASFPQGLLTCVTGVSGSGKSTLVNDILGNAAALKLNGAKTIPGSHKSIAGLSDFRTVVRVDQEPIGKSPRSNPATYIKLFDLLRKLFAQTPLSRVRGYTPSRFSFNMRGGRCERCGGDGVIRLEMHFLSDVYVPCPSCNGKRYNRETLEARFSGYNIADVLGMSVDEAAEVFKRQPAIMQKLSTLQAVGLGYLKLGQPATTLSGGEAQRIKLSLELSRKQTGDSLYILDEPTTGLHWLDTQKLMDLLFRLRDAGNTIIIIEHDLNVVRLADWVIDLGPGGGDAGGRIVYAGPLKGLANCKESVTGEELRKCIK